MPALSCPRCCSAYRPRYVSFEASALPKIPNTPHSSLNLSTISRSPQRHDQESYKCTASCNSSGPFEVPLQAARPERLGFRQRLIKGVASVHGDANPGATDGADSDRGNIGGRGSCPEIRQTPRREQKG